MSATSSARRMPRFTARVWCSISSSVTDKVFSCPRTTMARESPTRMMSTPASSTRRAVGVSYAVRHTIFRGELSLRNCVSACGWNFLARMSGTVILPLPASIAALIRFSWCRSHIRDTARRAYQNSLPRIGGGRHRSGVWLRRRSEVRDRLANLGLDAAPSHGAALNGMLHRTEKHDVHHLTVIE